MIASKKDANMQATASAAVASAVTMGSLQFQRLLLLSSMVANLPAVLHYMYVQKYTHVDSSVKKCDFIHCNL
jgi:hypothetical protein